MHFDAFDPGDMVDVHLANSVDSDRVDRARVLRHDDHVLVVQADRAGGPIFHVHPDGAVDLESPNLGRVMPDWGHDAVVEPVD